MKSIFFYNFFIQAGWVRIGDLAFNQIRTKGRICLGKGAGSTGSLEWRNSNNSSLWDNPLQISYKYPITSLSLSLSSLKMSNLAIMRISWICVISSFLLIHCQSSTFLRKYQVQSSFAPFAAIKDNSTTSAQFPSKLKSGATLKVPIHIKEGGGNI